MPLEIKELVIKANIRQELEPPRRAKARSEDLSSFRKQLLQDCRRMVREMIQESHRR